MALLLLCTQAFAQTFVEVQDKHLPSLESYSWEQFKTDDCLQYLINNKNEDKLRDSGFRRCKDGSVSFVQPDSSGWNGWEGKCGQTAASNTLYHMCKVAKDPKDYMDRYLSDITPGVRPKTLYRGMKNIFKENSSLCPRGSWSHYSSGSTDKFIEEVKQKIIPKYSHERLVVMRRDGVEKLRQPVMVLIQNPSSRYLHWVTIMDVLDKNECLFVVNHWDNQYQLPCDLLAEWSDDVGHSYPIILRSLSYVTFK